MLEIIHTQLIVESLMSILGKNINIMNTQGIIIASGDAGRLHTYHAAAFEAVKQNKIVNVDTANQHLYENCKQGTNIPIMIYGEVIGIVGITGTASLVANIGLTIKQLVEFMILEQLKQKEDAMNQSAKEDFIRDLCTSPASHGSSAKAAAFAFDFSIQRSLYIIQMVQSEEHFQALHEQYVKQSILEHVKKAISQQDTILYLYKNYFLLLLQKSAQEEELLTHMKETVFQRYSLPIQYIQSLDCLSEASYKKSFHLAEEIMQHVRISHDKVVTHVKEYAFDYFISKTDSQYRDEYLALFDMADITKKHLQDIIALASMLLHHQMNIQAVAQHHFLHRNTITNKIKKYQERYNIDLSDCFVCMKFYLLKYLDV